MSKSKSPNANSSLLKTKTVRYSADKTDIEGEISISRTSECLWSKQNCFVHKNRAGHCHGSLWHMGQASWVEQD